MFIRLISSKPNFPYNRMKMRVMCKIRINNRTAAKGHLQTANSVSPRGLLPDAFQPFVTSIGRQKSAAYSYWLFFGSTGATHKKSSHANQETNSVANTQMIRSFLLTIGSLTIKPSGIPHRRKAKRIQVSMLSKSIVIMLSKRWSGNQDLLDDRPLGARIRHLKEAFPVNR